MSRTNKSSAFTLVELLVVITIIGILAGLISVAAINAVNSAKNARIKMEVSQMDGALKAFKAQYGAYPPSDMSNPATNVRLKSFLSKAFPRYNQSTLVNDLNLAGVTGADPANALVFWLVGLHADVTQPFLQTEPFTEPDPTTLNGKWDPGEPYTDSNGNGRYDLANRTAFFAFDKTRLIDMENNGLPARAWTRTGKMVYVPAGADMPTPYVYFNSSSYGVASANPGPAFFPSTSTSPGSAVPYVQDNDKSLSLTAGDLFANPDSFQIICAGQDGVYGIPVSGGPAPLKLFPPGVNYALEDNDNVTNFCDMATLGDAR